MITIEETGEILDEIAEELPAEFYEKLNGGILLLPEVKMHPESKNNDLYIMGQYHHDSVMGRYIQIYYGSFAKIYGDLPREEYKEKLRRTLLHEFTHHIEGLAGECGLELKDKIEDILNNGETVLVHVLTDPEENVYPIIPVGKGNHEMLFAEEVE